MAQKLFISLEPAQPVGLISCFDTDQLKVAVWCSMIPKCIQAENCTEEFLQSFLDGESQE